MTIKTRASGHDDSQRRLGRLGAVVATAAAALLGCASPAERQVAPAQTVYTNGTVITVDGKGSTAEAVAVSEGKIVGVGTAAQMARHVGSQTRVVDLGGKILAPGIYDAHSHFVYVGIADQFEADLNSPPVGKVSSIDALVARLQQHQARLAANAWVTGFGYDDTLLAERRHPTRADLDRVSTSQPVFVVHVSGHLAVANSAALALAGITAATPNPTGGVIRRGGNGEPDGVLEETAQQLVAKLKPALSAAQLRQAIKAAGRIYASQGITTANDGGAGPAFIASLEQAAQAGDLPVRVVAWPMYDVMAASDKVPLKSGKVKIGGVKDLADGSIQGYTAHLAHPYHTPFHGDPNYRGFPRYDREVLAKRVTEVYKAGRQSLIHANGDQAIADVLNAFRKAQEAYPRADARPVIVHSQTASLEQMDEMKALGVIPSFFVLHTYYWGDRHRDIFLGPERSSRISPARWAAERSLPYTIHTDSPVVPMEPMRLIWSAVNRVSTTGAVLGAEQRLTPLEALRATTLNAAYQNFEERDRGSIEVGKSADLVIWSANPLTVDPMTIRDIRALETIVEGKTVYRAPD